MKKILAAIAVLLTLSSPVSAQTLGPGPTSQCTTATPWTPVATFLTPGDLNVVYSTQVGNYVQCGKQITAAFKIVTSTFTFTTAGNHFQITGLPAASINSIAAGGGSIGIAGGLTYTDGTFLTIIVNQNAAIAELFWLSNSDGNNVNVSNFTTGTNITISGVITYLVP